MLSFIHWRSICYWMAIFGVYVFRITHYKVLKLNIFMFVNSITEFFFHYNCSLLLLTVLYALMFISVRKTRQAARISTGDFDFAVRFFFIVLANCICWLPIIILKFAALKKIHISSIKLFFYTNQYKCFTIS